MAKADTEVEIRVSTIPVAFGEKVVMRIMDPDILFQDLEQLGFTVKTAIHGEEAVALSASWQPDLIWMDIKM